MSDASETIPQDKLELFTQLIDTHPDIELKGGKKMAYTSHNGNMYTLLSKEGKVGIRLGKEEREAFIQKYDSQLCVQYGAVMKEYVEVPDTLLPNTDELKPYLAMSYAYVQTLKPKPTKKKKK